MSRHLMAKAAALGAITLGLAACATAPSTTMPPATAGAGASVALANSTKAHPDAGCVVIVGGGIGGRLADVSANEAWHQLNATVTQALAERLAAEGLRTYTLVVSPSQTSRFDGLLQRAVNDRRCPRVLQLSHLVQQDQFGPFFRFDIQLMRLPGIERRSAPVKNIRAAMRGEYEKSYRFARTRDTINTFRAAPFADTAFADLKASPAWPPLLSPAAP